MQGLVTRDLEPKPELVSHGYFVGSRMLKLTHTPDLLDSGRSWSRVDTLFRAGAGNGAGMLS